MNKLTRDDLFSLEKYAEVRPDFRARVMEHKKNRRLAIGPNANLYFEDRLTIQYQIQEMLRIEKIFEVDGINEELEAYNPLIPEGKNWKATFMLEFGDADERKMKLAELVGVEANVWIQVEGFDRIVPIYNEDLERSTESKTSSVHFMRFELTDEMINALKSGASLSAGIDNPSYPHIVDPVAKNICNALIEDLEY
ncbi:MAG: DUF3501 family protein, partial [Gammaproteobacteria bacterium]|nr:DUF3501 family protein [Gammaproteobacteria bacterium]